MQKVKIFIFLLIFFSIGKSYGFHDEGVANCSGCHIIHNSEDGTLIDQNSPNGNDYKYLGLSCHATQNGEVFGSDPLNPPPEKGAGNFVFLLEDNLNDKGNSSIIIDGNSAGHNLNAPSRGLTADPNYTTSPGGSMPTSLMGCTSCHDPHGNGNFRMLNSAGSIQDGAYIFTYNAPLAEGIDLSTEESKTNHTAYISGISEWCGNCHGPSYHDNESAGPTFEHPSPENLEPGMINRYNTYNGTADPNGTTVSLSYIPEVPFEDNANTTSSTMGPSGASKVACISCHRAHATSAPSAGRWDFHVQFLDDDGSLSGSYPIPNPYPGPTQNRLCNKCHPNMGSGGVVPNNN